MKNEISLREKKLRRLEVSEIDPDIIIAASKAKMGYNPERLQRLQMMRDLKRIAGFLKQLLEAKP